MALAHQYQYMKVQIGTVDFTSYLANTEQTATMPAGAEVGRATLTFRDEGSMPAIPKWGTVVISSGTAAPGTPVWGGYATRQSCDPVSMHGGTVRMVTVDCQSYAIALSTTPPITETYGGGDNDSILQDSAIVTDLVATYLPAFFDGGSISSANPVQCDYIQFSDETLRSALNKVVERSAKEYGITAGADFYYRPTGSAGTLGHQLSDAPDNSDSFPMQAKPYSDRDDVEVRNAVRVVGGWTLSAVQDETFTTDGIAYSFVVNYFPQDIIRVRLANVVLSVGVYLVDPPADFDVLVHYDQRKFIFQLPPSAGKTLEIEYRYPVRVQEDVIDAASVAEVGGTIWGATIQDSSISQATVAQFIGSAYLARSTASIDRGQLTTSWVGTAIPYLPGQIVRVSAQALDWSSNEMEIQSVTMRFAPRPGGTGVCLTYWDLDVGTPVTIGQIIGGVYRDAPEVRMKTHAPDIREAITAGDVPTLDHGMALTGLGDDDHTQYLLATGTRTGASSQAQTFTNGIDLAKIYDSSVLVWHRPGTQNMFGGYQAGLSTVSGYGNTGFGHRAIPAVTTGFANTAVGGFAFENLTEGYYNLAFGYSALQSLITGSGNVGLGAFALNRVTDGYSNMAIGYYSLRNNVHGVNNVAIGSEAMATFAPASAVGRNLAIGSSSLNALTTGINNVAIGTAAGLAATTGDNNIFIGNGGGQYETGSNKLIITSQYYGSEAADRLSAIIYGEMSGTVANQMLRVNAQLQVMRASSTTNAADTVAILAHNTSGTPAAGFGSSQVFALESSTTQDQTAATLNVQWADATHATRSAYFRFYTTYQGSLVDVAKFGGTTGNVFNGDGTDWCDFRVAGDTATNLFFVDASADMVGVGTSGPSTRLHIQQTSADTNVVRNLLTIEHQSTGTPAAGLGAGLIFALESTTTTNQSAALVDGSWSEATHASRKGQVRLWAHDASAARLGLTIGTDGSAAVVGLYAAPPVAQATTSGAAASFTANSGTAVNDASTFDGYTIKQIVKALRNLGALA